MSKEKLCIFSQPGFCSSFVMEEQAWGDRNEYEKYTVRMNVTPGQMKLL